MCGIGHAKLAALHERRHAVVIRDPEKLGVRYGAKQVAHEAVEFGVGDEVGGLLVQQRSTEHARQSDQSVASAGQAVRLAIGTDQLTLDTECGGLQRDKTDVLKSRAIQSLAKHDC